MKEKEEDEKLLGELIKKRKDENEAFIKLLQAMENKTQDTTTKNQSNEKTHNHKSIL